MTVEELSRLPRLRGEIKQERERLFELREAASSPPSPNLSGMPRAPGYGPSRIEKYVARIIDTERRIEAKEREAVMAEARIWEFIGSSPHHDINVIIIYRFIFGLTWEKVADSLSTSRTIFKAPAIKKRFTRYMESAHRES